MELKFTDTLVLICPANQQELLHTVKHLQDGKSRKVILDPTALERILGGTAPVPQIADPVALPAGAANPPLQTEQVQTPTPSPTAETDLDRDQIKVQLDAMGVEYNKRWGLERLRTFLAAQQGESCSAPAATAAPVAPAAPVTPAAPAPQKTVVPSRDDVLQAMKGLITGKGKQEGTQAAKAILDEYGAANISGIKPGDYAGVIAAAKKALA